MQSRRGIAEAAWLAGVGLAAAGLLAVAARPDASVDGKPHEPDQHPASVALARFNDPHTSPIGPAVRAIGAAAGGAAEVQPALPALGRSGWLAVYSAAGASEVKSFAHNTAFFLQPGQTVDPQVPASGFNATFSSVLRVEDAGTYTFAVEAEGGAAAITVMDGGLRELAKAERPFTPGSSRIASKPAALAAGDYLITTTFRRGADRPARLRAFWSRQRTDANIGFVMEPIPSSAVHVPSHGEQSADRALQALHGRTLMGVFGCVNCHEASEAQRTALTPVSGPVLGDAGARFSPEWMREWIKDPLAMKPGTHMPAVLGDSPADREAAENITHFLVSRAGPFRPEPVAQEASVLGAGKALYHSVGCVACHGPQESPAAAFNEEALSKDLPAAAARIPLGKIGAKWRPSALSEFLLNPRAHRPGGRMPSLKLTPEEADAITTYLLTRLGAPAESPFKIDAARVEKGRDAFASYGCASCHDMTIQGGRIESTAKAKKLSELGAGKGCLGESDPRAPRFGLGASDRAAIGAAMEQLKTAVVNPAPLDQVHRVMETFNCRACHTYEGSGGAIDGSGLAIKDYFRSRGEAELGDEGRVPPRLSGVGWKLTTPWLRQVLTEGGSARPYVATRMPQFGEKQVTPLVAGLAACDGVRPDSDAPEPKSSDELTTAGRVLVGSDGLNCISCHVFGRSAPAGTPGPNITDFGERLRYEWWKTYVMDPARMKVGTRMPLFYPTGEGQITKIFGGEATKQIDAMWAYFSLGFAAPAPDGLPKAGASGYVLKPGARPIVIRTFLKDAGARGIAVGYPAGTHFAFDAGAVRLISAWTGDFLDAGGAWASRGGNIAEGRGKTVWEADPGLPLRVLKSGEAPGSEWSAAVGITAGVKFKGYTLDGDGVPSFRYVVGGTDGIDVVERCLPPTAPGSVARREFLVSGHRERTIELRAGKREAKTSAEGAEVTGAGSNLDHRVVVKPKTDAPVRIVLDLLDAR